MRLTRPFIALMLLIMLFTAACGGGETTEAVNTNTEVPPTMEAQNVEPTAADTVADAQVEPTVDTSTVDTAAQVEATAINVEIPADAVALVNGVPISRELYQRNFESQLSVYPDVAEPTVLAAQVLDNLIEQELIEQAAANMGITVTDTEIDDEISLYKQQVTNSNMEWEAWLAENNLANEAELREDVFSALLTQKVIEQITASLDEPVLHANARHILVTSQDTAQEILNRLNAGESFETLAAEYSLDNSTKDRGGDLGWFTEYELTDPRLARFAFSLQPGEIGGPFATTMGFHIVQTIAFEERLIEPLDRLAEIKGSAFNVWVQSLYQGATIVRNTQ